MDVLFEVKCCLRLALIDQESDKSATADHGEEIGHAIAHVGGLECESVAGGKQGIRLAEASIGSGERLVEAFNGFATVYDSRRAVIALGRDSGEVRGPESKQGVH